MLLKPLNIPKGTGQFKTDKFGKTEEIMRSPLADMLKYQRAKLPGISVPDWTYVEQKDVYRQSWLKETSPYMNKFYYETIYRTIFNTINNFDIVLSCEKKLVSFPKLLEAANNKFGFNLSQIKNLNYDQVCDLLSKESKKRKEIKDELKIGVPEVEPMIKYQPGSQIVSQLTQGTQSMLAPILEPQKNINPVYGQIYNICLDPNSTKDEIINEALKMGLFEIIKTGKTKKIICRTLINYIETTQTNKLF